MHLRTQRQVAPKPPSVIAGYCYLDEIQLPHSLSPQMFSRRICVRAHAVCKEMSPFSKWHELV